MNYVLETTDKTIDYDAYIYHARMYTTEELQVAANAAKENYLRICNTLSNVWTGELYIKLLEEDTHTVYVVFDLDNERDVYYQIDRKMADRHLWTARLCVGKECANHMDTKISDEEQMRWYLDNVAKPTQLLIVASYERAVTALQNHLNTLSDSRKTINTLMHDYIEQHKLFESTKKQKDTEGTNEKNEIDNSKKDTANKKPSKDNA